MNDEILITRSAVQKESQSTSYPSERIDLPSKGYFYSDNDPLSLGYIDMKMMTAKEEDILTSPNLLKKGIAIDKLLESLLVDKSVKLNNLLTGDKNALIFAARRLAYGDNYGPVDVTCPKCQAVNKVNIDLGELKEKELDESNFQKGANAFDYTLPNSKVSIKFKYLTDDDEKLIEKENVSMLKINKFNSTEVTSRLKRMIIEVNGDSDPAKIKSFVDGMQSRDSLALRQYIRESTPDINSTFDFCCKECGAEERAVVPMTVQFFWPDSRV